MKKWVLIGFLGIIITFGCVQTTESQLELNCKNVQVPYTEQETYVEREPYVAEKCTDRFYDAKGGYIDRETQWEGRWLLQSLYYTVNGEEKPLSGVSQQEYYVTNYENRLGTFTIKINFVNNENEDLNSFEYITIQVGPKETEYGKISYDLIQQQKPLHAVSYYLSLISPKLEECRNVIDYEDVTRYRPIIKYKTEQQCN